MNFVVYSEHGQTQISDTGFDLGLVGSVELGKGLTRPPFPFSNRYDYGDTDINDYENPNNRICVLQPNNGEIGMRSYYKEWPVRFRYRGNRDSKIWLLDTNPDVTNNGFGIQTFNEQGEVTYSSHQPSLNIIDHIKLTVTQQGGIKFQKQYPTAIGIIAINSPIIPTSKGEYGAIFSVVNGYLKVQFLNKDYKLKYNYDGHEMPNNILEFYVVDTSHF